MRSLRKHRLTAVGLGAIVAAVALGGSAVAGGGAEKAAKPKALVGVEPVSVPIQLTPQAINNGVSEFNLNCPGGTTLTDGGALFISGAPLPTTDVVLFESGPLGNGWHLRYDNDTADSQFASIHALCLKNKLKVKGASGGGAKSGSAQAAAKKPKAVTGLQQLNQSVTVPPQSTNNGVSEFTLNCAAGTTLVGGGATLPPGTALPTNIELFESGPQSNAWHARWNNNQAVAQPATLSAICLNSTLKVNGRIGGGAKSGSAQAAAKKPRARTSIQQVAQTVTLPPQGTNAGVAEFNVACPAGTTVVGGGGLFSSGTPLTSSIELFESGPQGNAWHVRFNNDLNADQGASVHAICLRNKLKVK